MFGLFKKTTKSQNMLWHVTFEVGRGTNCEMPPNLSRAFVPVFVSAPDHEAAGRIAGTQLKSRGYELLDISFEGRVDQLDPFQWDAYVQKTWPEFLSHFPAQKQVIAGLPEGLIFFGPFASYEGIGG